jgi:hypothetical protein
MVSDIYCSSDLVGEGILDRQLRCSQCLLHEAARRFYEHLGARYTQDLLFMRWDV